MGSRRGSAQLALAVASMVAASAVAGCFAAGSSFDLEACSTRGADACGTATLEPTTGRVGDRIRITTANYFSAIDGDWCRDWGVAFDYPWSGGSPPHPFVSAPAVILDGAHANFRIPARVGPGKHTVTLLCSGAADFLQPSIEDLEVLPPDHTDQPDNQ